MTRSPGDVRRSCHCHLGLRHPPDQQSDRRVTPIADPPLTPLGEQQAQDAHAAWEKERRFGIPLPEKLYTSPLTRAIRTHQVTFDDTLLPSRPKTMIVEVNLVRQADICMMLMTCCKEHPRTQWRSYLRQAGNTLRHSRRVPRIRLRGGVRGE